MRILVSGARGLLGAAILREFSSTGDVVAMGHAELDVADERAVTAAFASTKPDVVINCAAYNDVDGAEDHATDALRVNAFGVHSFARAAAEHRTLLVHYSSDFVFDGDTASPYTEEDSPNPRGVYAASKLLGDWFALDGATSWVLRVESLFGTPSPDGKRIGSLGTIVSGIRAGEEVPVFVDRTVSPTYTADVARATRQILERRPATGLYHCANSGVATWAEVAEEAARLLGMPLRARPMTLESAALKAARPRYSALSNAKLGSVGIEMPPWRDALRRYLSEARS